MLYGSLDAGWFGVVSTEELMDHFGFYSGLFRGETPLGVIMTGALFWMKFAYKGRFIFVPSRPVMMSVPWDTIYNLGAVYPFEQETHYLAAGVAQVRQGKLLTVQEGEKTWRLKPRLPRLAAVDPLPTQMNGAVPWDSGEYWELYRHIHKTGPYGDGAWANLGSQINYESEEIILNSQPSPFTQTYTEAFNMSRTSYFAKSGYPYYRPVLEVVNDREIIVPLEQKVYKIEGRLIAPVVNIVQDLDPGNRLQHIALTHWTASDLPTPVTAPLTSVPLARVRTIKYGTTELPIPVAQIDKQ